MSKFVFVAKSLIVTTLSISYLRTILRSFLVSRSADTLPISRRARAGCTEVYFFLSIISEHLNEIIAETAMK